jgi:uncharacterized protein with FMN-binding domain
MASRKSVIAVLMYALLLAGCRQMPPPNGAVPRETLRDGVYRAEAARFPNRAEVEVTVAAGRIAKVVVLRHWAWRGKGIEETLADRIVAKQSPQVDAVSGATNSSHVIMQAARTAIAKAAAAP